MPFEKGQSGNPGGRPKRKIFTDAMRVQLLSPVTFGADGRVLPPELPTNPRYVDVVANQMIIEAYSGENSTQAGKEIRDTTDGKPAQSLEHSGMIASTHEELLKQLMTPTEREIRLRLRSDFPYYAPRCLKIRTKNGSIEPFRLNKPQRYLHETLERQLAETGRVRTLILKGRQQGVSSYTEGRFFWRVTHRPGTRVFILTHMDDATNNLFGMAKRFYENCPEVVRPSLAASNAKELIFYKLDSSYKVVNS
jgi:hypothetical protein